MLRQWEGLSSICLFATDITYLSSWKWSNQIRPWDICGPSGIDRAFIYPTTSLSKLVMALAPAQTALNGLNEILCQPKEDNDGRVLAQPFHALDVEQVCLDLDRHAVLRNVTLSIKSGEHLAIIGASGSGKSSLLKLIANFYQPDQGHILWNQQEVKDYTQNSFRGQLAYVEQEACLFHGTLAENIACTPDIDIKRMQQALENANLSDGRAIATWYTINDWPASSNISGGQKQRIAIARALYKSASLLLLVKSPRR